MQHLWDLNKEDTDFSKLGRNKLFYDIIIIQQKQTFTTGELGNNVENGKNVYLSSFDALKFG